MCVFVETNTEKIITLPLLVVKAKRWTALEEMQWEVSRTVITLTWNQTTGTFDQNKVDQTIVMQSKPAAVPPATPPPPQIYVTQIEAQGALTIIDGRTIQTFTYYKSDGSQQTFTLVFVGGNYYWHNGTSWQSAPDVGGPWGPSSAPPQNATPPNGAGGTVHDQN